MKDSTSSGNCCTDWNSSGTGSLNTVWRNTLELMLLIMKVQRCLLMKVREDMLQLKEEVVCTFVQPFLYFETHWSWHLSGEFLNVPTRCLP